MKLTTVIASVLMCAPVFALAVPAPKYLSVPNFKQCLGTVTQFSQGSSTSFLCMPSAQPTNCPAASWKALNNLKGKDAVAFCPVVVIPAVQS